MSARDQKKCLICDEFYGSRMAVLGHDHFIYFFSLIIFFFFFNFFYINFLYFFSFFFLLFFFMYMYFLYIFFHFFFLRFFLRFFFTFFFFGPLFLLLLFYFSDKYYFLSDFSYGSCGPPYITLVESDVIPQFWPMECLLFFFSSTFSIYWWPVNRYSLTLFIPGFLGALQYRGGGAHSPPPA